MFWPPTLHGHAGLISNPPRVLEEPLSINEFPFQLIYQHHSPWISWISLCNEQPKVTMTNPISYSDVGVEELAPCQAAKFAVGTLLGKGRLSRKRLSSLPFHQRLSLHWPAKGAKIEHRSLAAVCQARGLFPTLDCGNEKSQLPASLTFSRQFSFSSASPKWVKLARQWSRTRSRAILRSS